VWDWNTLPGTTSQPNSDAIAKNVKHLGASNFTGGCVESLPSSSSDRASASASSAAAIAVSTMDYASDGKPAPDLKFVLSAQKSYVFLDDSVVAMGTQVQLQSKIQRMLS
jgi:hypothetical protein